MWPSSDLVMYIANLWATQIRCKMLKVRLRRPAVWWKAYHSSSFSKNNFKSIWDIGIKSGELLIHEWTTSNTTPKHFFWFVAWAGKRDKVVSKCLIGHFKIMSSPCLQRIGSIWENSKTDKECLQREAYVSYSAQTLVATTSEAQW